MAVTRAQVAAHAGVSPAVVSYVVNGGPRPVSAKTRSRVEAAIAELDYRPNRIAAALRGSMTHSVGLLTPSPTNPFFAELSATLVREFFARGNALSVAVTDEDSARELLHLKSFLDRRVDGVILTSAGSVAALEELGPHSVPVLVVDRVGTMEVPAFSRLHVENTHGARLATEHLQQHGHQIIGCIAGPPTEHLVAERVQGWRQQQQQLHHGRADFDSLLEHGDFSAAGGYAAAHALLGPGSRRAASGEGAPTALFVASDVQAFGVLLACRELGLRVPQDIAIASFDGTELGQFANPPLASVRQPIEEIARVATQVLLDRIADPALEPAHQTFKGDLLIGRSCGCAHNGAPRVDAGQAGGSPGSGATPRGSA